MTDWKTVGKWVLGFVAAGGALWWLQKYLQQQQSNAEADAQAQNQNDAQLAAMLLQQPLATANYTAEPVATSTPSVDTGNASIQALIQSILNPPASTTQSNTGTSGATSTPANSAPTTYEPPKLYYNNPAPTQSGGPIINQLSNSTFTTQPGILHMIPATNTVQ